MAYKLNPLTGELEYVEVEAEGVSKITVAVTEPTTPTSGDLWVDIS